MGPVCGAHTPGVSHVAADRLSRVHSPDGSGKVDSNIHPALANAEHTATPLRDKKWYQAYDEPPATKVAKRKWWGGGRL